MNRPRLLLLLLLAAALMLRLGWVWQQPTDDQSLNNLPDQVEYLSLGRNLLQEHRLYFFDTRFDQNIYAYRTPGYPFLIAACGGQVRLVRLVQVLLDTSTVLAVYLLAMQISSQNRWLSLLASALVAVNPFLIYFSGLILSETLFISLLAWGMWCMSAASGKPIQLTTSLAGGVILAFAVLVRPSAMFLPVLVPLAAVFLNKPSDRPYQTGRRVSILMAVNVVLLVAMLLPWAIRNHNILGHWVWTTTNSGITVYDGFNPKATGASDQRFLQDLASADLKQMGELERSKYFRELAWDYALAHPWRSVELGISKIARTWSPLPLSNQFGDKGLYVAAAMLYSVPLDLLILAGLLSTRLSRMAKVFVLIPAIYFTVIHAMSVGSLRYRLPAEPPLAILAASAVTKRKQA